MPPQAVSLALEFLYTGKINKRAGLHLASLEQVFARLLVRFKCFESLLPLAIFEQAVATFFLQFIFYFPPQGGEAVGAANS